MGLVTVLDFPLETCEAIIDTLSQLSPGDLTPEELELLEALREAHPLLLEIHHAKNN